MELINTNILNYTTIKIRIIKDIWMDNEGEFKLSNEFIHFCDQ